MTAENIYTIAEHLDYSELQRLYFMLDKKINPHYKPKKQKKVLTDKDAIDYLLRNVFRKVKKTTAK